MDGGPDVARRRRANRQLIMPAPLTTIVAASTSRICRSPRAGATPRLSASSEAAQCCPRAGMKLSSGNLTATKTPSSAIATPDTTIAAGRPTAQPRRPIPVPRAPACRGSADTRSRDRSASFRRPGTRAYPPRGDRNPITVGGRQRYFARRRRPARRATSSCSSCPSSWPSCSSSPRLSPHFATHTCQRNVDQTSTYH